MKKKTIIQMVLGILFLLTLIISSTYAYFNIVNTSSNNTTSNYNAKLEDIEKYGTSLLTGGEGELHLRVKASDMTPSKIGNKYYATTSEDDYQLRRGNHIVSKATIQKGLSNYEYNCTSKLTITLYGTMVSEDGLQVGDAKIYLRGTNNNIKNEEYDLKTLIDELETNGDGKKEYTREIEYLLTSDNEGKVMIDVEFANNANKQTTSSGKNINIEITNSELVCGLGNSKVYANLYGNSSDKYAYRSNDWKDKIITASFVNYKPNEEELLTKPMYWDLSDTSKSEAGSVIGWLEEREQADTYDLYIGSDKEIYTTNLGSAFSSMISLQEIKFDNLNTSETTNMGNMFYNCTNLISLDLSSFNTSKVIDMTQMFIMCGKLITLNISNFDTSNVTEMSQIFRECSSLREIIGINMINTSKVRGLSNMFQKCTSLTTLNLDSMDITKATYTSGMFDDISATLIFPKDFGRNSKTMKGIFSGYNGTFLDISNFDTSSVTDMSYMFSSLKKITSIDQIKGFKELDTSNATNMSYMFSSFKGTTLDLSNLSNFNTSKVTNMSYMFSNCSSLTNLDISHFDISKVTNMHSMFNGLGVKSLEDIKGLYEFDTSKVTDIGGIFANCINLTEIDLTKFELDSVTNMSNMFSGLNGITSTDQIKGFKELDTSKVTDMSGMFSSFNGTTLDLSTFDTSSVTNMSSMFNSCRNLVNINLKSFKTKNVTNMSWMFAMNSGSGKLTNLDLSSFDTSNVTNMTNMFLSNNSLIKLDLSNFDTSKVTNMSDMFENCSNLTSLNLSNFTTSSVTTMSGMFSSCRNLKELKLNKATFDKVTSYSGMFNSVPNDIHLTIKKGQETFINDRLNDAKVTTANIDLVD